MTLPADPAARAALVLDQLNTSVLGDIMDMMGHRHRFLPPEVRAIRDGMRLCGRAMPVLVADVFGAGPEGARFGKLTQALDALQPGDVYLARQSRQPVAAWGEILTTTAQLRGAAGAVMDGYHRDHDKVLEADFPLFSRGAYGRDAGVRSHVLDYGVPIEIDGVWIEPGDLILGDADGVIVVPAAIEAEVIERALEKVSAENVVLDAIRGGMSATEAFRRYGVL